MCIHNIYISNMQPYLKHKIFWKARFLSFNLFPRRIYSLKESRYSAATLGYGEKWIAVNFTDISCGKARQLRCLPKSHGKWWRKQTTFQCSFLLVREMRRQIILCFVRSYCARFVLYSLLKSEERSEWVFSLSLHSHIETRFHVFMHWRFLHSTSSDVEGWRRRRTRLHFGRTRYHVHHIFAVEHGHMRLVV